MQTDPDKKTQKLTKTQFGIDLSLMFHLTQRHFTDVLSSQSCKQPNLNQ